MHVHAMNAQQKQNGDNTMKPNQKENEPQTMSQKQIDEYFSLKNKDEKIKARYKKYNKRRSAILSLLADAAINAGMTISESNVIQRVNARKGSYTKLDLEGAIVNK
jgi:hypothetical protein